MLSFFIQVADPSTYEQPVFMHTRTCPHAPGGVDALESSLDLLLAAIWTVRHNHHLSVVVPLACSGNGRPTALARIASETAADAGADEPKLARARPPLAKSIDRLSTGAAEEGVKFWGLRIVATVLKEIKT